MPSAFFLVLAVGVAIVVLVGYLGWRAERRRREQLMRLAAGRGWSYLARDDSLCNRWQGPPFGTGDHRAARHVLTGSYDGRPMVAFDHSYQTHSTDAEGRPTTTTHRHAVCVLGLPARVPSLAVGPESLVSRVGSAFGFGDVELESESFNRRFRVKSPDPRFAYDVLSPRTMERLLASDSLHWRTEGAVIVCWEQGRAAPAELLQRLCVLSAVVSGVPDYVWRDHGAPDETGSGTVIGDSV